MRRQENIARAIARLGATAFVCGVCFASFAQAASAPPISTDGSDPSKWDKKLDGPIAAPANHKIIYEDSNIRVQSVTVPAGTEEAYHLHPYPSVLVFDQNGKMVDRSKGGKEISMKDEVAIEQTDAPMVLVQPPNALHSIKNLSGGPIHLIRVEFKKGQIAKLIPRSWPVGKMPASTDGSDPKKWDSKKDGPVAAPGNHKVIYEDANLRVQSVSIPAHTAEPYHLHLLPSVLVVDEPNMGIDADIHGKGPELRSDGPPVVLITPPNAEHSIKNTGGTDGHLVRIEFKHGFPAPFIGPP